MTWLASAFAQVLETSLAATVLIGVAWLVIACFQNRLPAWVRYGVWLLVFLRLVMPIAPQADFSVWNLRKAGNPSAAPALIVSPPSLPAATEPMVTLRNESCTPVLPLVWLAGLLIWIAAAVVQHRRLAGVVREFPMCRDARVLNLLDQARAAFRVRKRILVLTTDRFEAPAIFGWLRPYLLLPDAWVENASTQEMYGALLHEVAHVKCRDGLLNWACIFLRAFHWFNPLVWYAFRRLRAEREVYCDALVLRRMPAERATYGNMLLRMAAQLSKPAGPETLLPVLQHKPEIRRRIHMIAKYKTTPWALSVAFTLLLVALACVTFTRAAEKQAPGQVLPRERVSADASERPRSFDILYNEVERQEQAVRKLQAKASALAVELGHTESSGSDVLQKLALLQADAKAEVIRLSSLYDHLRQLNRVELLHAVNAASPDQQLSQLVQHRDLSEQKLTELIETVAPEHPDVKRMTRVLAQISKQIDSRLEGILNGMKTQLAARKAHLKELSSELESANRNAVERSLRQGPYQDVLRELQTEQEVLHRLRLRFADERISDALERATPK